MEAGRAGGESHVGAGVALKMNDAEIGIDYQGRGRVAAEEGLLGFPLKVERGGLELGL